MIKTVLVPATGNDTDAACFAAALAVARGSGAHIEALHVRIDPVEVAMAMSSEGTGGVLVEGIIADVTRDADEREARARSAFAAFCQREAVTLGGSPGEAEPTAEFRVETGQEARWMVAYAMTCDLVVASRGVAGANAVARSTLEALLLESGHPLLLPGTAQPWLADRIAIAWKPTPQAARAVALSMPFLARAKQVAVLTVEEDSSVRDEADRLVGHLAWHGVQAAAERLSPGPQGAAQTMLAAAAAKADLLVMGGYGHTRLREWVFGGFTQSALNDASLAVLIVH